MPRTHLPPPTHRPQTSKTLCPPNPLHALSPPFRNEPPGTPLNAITPTKPETAADRTERQLRGCRELFELGMQVARAAAREAVANLDTPIEHPMPGARLPPVCRTHDPGRLFTRAAYAARQAIALENRIVAGDFAPLPVHRTPRPGQAHSPASPPRAPRFGIQAETAESFHQEGFEDFGNRPPEQILAAIRQTLGITPNITPENAPDLAPNHVLRNAPPCLIRPAPPPATPAQQPAARRVPPQPPPRPG